MAFAGFLKVACSKTPPRGLVDQAGEPGEDHATMAADPARVQSSGDLVQRRGAGSLYLPDRGQHVGRVGVR